MIKKLSDDPESTSSQQQLLLLHSSLEEAEESSAPHSQDAAVASHWPTAATPPSHWSTAATLPAHWSTATEVPAHWMAAKLHDGPNVMKTASASQMDLNRSTAVLPTMRKATSVFSNMNLCSQTSKPCGAGVSTPLLPTSLLDPGDNSTPEVKR